jgi:hypothetical protein
MSKSKIRNMKKDKDQSKLVLNKLRMYISKSFRLNNWLDSSSMMLKKKYLKRKII